MPLPEAPEKRPVAPEVTKAAVPLGKDEFRVGLGAALIDAGSEMFTDAGGITPVDAASDESVLSSFVMSSEKLKAPKDPPPSPSSSVPLELGVGTKADVVSEMNPVEAGMVMLADAGGRKPAEPVERSPDTNPDAEATLVF